MQSRKAMPAPQSQPLAATIAVAVALMVTLSIAAALSGLLIGAAPTASVSPTSTARAQFPPPPTPSATPFDPSVGAPLPTDRIVTFYGITGGQDVNGPASFLPINTLPDGTTLQQLGQEYQAADPSHPVKIGLDVVVNVFENCLFDPSFLPDCSSTAAPSVIQNIVDYCQQNNFLLFLDVQLGKTTVQDMVTTLLPYLKNPWVELELDTEFHFPPSMPPSQIFLPGGGYIRGSMDASEINWAVDQLAQLVIEYHLPRKVLVFNQFDYGIITHIPQIRTNPYVSIVQQMDGFGYPGLKIGNYGLFVTQQLIQYGGFKLFTTYPDSTCCVDTPLMTPAEVLSSLNPAPLFLSYQ
jgi:hypothetical protein